jgi:hypothetical protein
MQFQSFNKNKWHLMLCEIHFPTIHGKTCNSEPNIETHYLVYDIYDPITKISLQNPDIYDYDDSDDSDDTNLSDMDNDIISLKRKYLLLSRYFIKYPNTNDKHPTIRNYYNIISKSNYIKAEIGEYIILPTQETVAILKTFWIRIIQKKWKKVFKQRQMMIQERCKIQNLKFRQTTGYWSEYCNKLPKLRGMLSRLKKK